MTKTYLKKATTLFFAAFFFLNSCDTENRNSISSINEYYIEAEDFLVPSEEYLIGTPSSVLINSENEVIVADDLGMQIIYFDSAGIFKKTIGQRGRGPKEFLHLTSVNLGKENEIVVADQFNSRFTVIGESTHSTHVFNPNDISWPRQIVQVENGYILVFKLDTPLEKELNAFSSKNSNSNYLFHYTKNLKDIVFSFGNVLDMPYSDDIFYQTWLGLNPGSILSYGNKLLYIPSIYNGEIFEYDYHNEQTEVNEIGLFRESVFTRIYHPPIPEHAIHISGKVSAAATIESESINLLKMDEDKFAHFSFQIINNQKKLYFEIFNASFDLIKSGFLKGFGDFDLRHNSSRFKIEAFDGKRFYVIDLRDREDEKIITFKLEL